jgi:hypothetical protein
MAAVGKAGPGDDGAGMRMPGECFHRQTIQAAFREEGRGLGFSIGGWHPFRINTYIPTLKKLDPLANTALGKAVWKPIEKLNQSVNKDFAKAKVWSQNHRKELQIAAAVAAAAVGGAFAMGYLGSGAAGAAGTAGAAGASEAAAGAAAGESVVATTFFAPEVLAPIVTGSTAASTAAAGLSFIPETVPALATAATGGGFLSSVGSALGATGSAVKDVLPLLTLAKALGGVQGSPQGQDGGIYGPNGWGGGGSSGYGGGTSLGPIFGAGGQPEPETAKIPSWVLPVAGGALLIYLLSE